MSGQPVRSFYSVFSALPLRFPLLHVDTQLSCFRLMASPCLTQLSNELVKQGVHPTAVIAGLNLAKKVRLREIASFVFGVYQLETETEI